MAESAQREHADMGMADRRFKDRPHDQAVALAYAEATRDAWKRAAEFADELKAEHYKAVLDAWDAGVPKQVMAKGLGVTRPRVIMIIKEMRESGGRGHDRKRAHERESEVKGDGSVKGNGK